MLKQSLTLRIQRWHDFRRHIALRTKLMFQHNLANRGYFGKVLFDHEKQKLELKVQTDDAAATQGLNKDTKSLSGGEKSFSTICLLLALWEAIGCPIRCLGKFLIVYIRVSSADDSSQMSSMSIWTLSIGASP